MWAAREFLWTRRRPSTYTMSRWARHTPLTSTRSAMENRASRPHPIVLLCVSFFVFLCSASHHLLRWAWMNMFNNVEVSLKIKWKKKQKLQSGSHACKTWSFVNHFAEIIWLVSSSTTVLPALHKLQQVNVFVRKHLCFECCSNWKMLTKAKYVFLLGRNTECYVLPTDTVKRVIKRTSYNSQNL